MTKATMHDGNELEVEIQGEGPFLLIPVNPTPVEGEAAEEMRRWGADPALGRTLTEGLQDIVTVVAFDYEGHVLAAPKPDTLTPSSISSDVLAIADAAGADTFAYYGYSWLALAGLQLAIRTNRLTALVMGGYPPLDGPYAEMLDVTAATHRMASEPGSAAPTTDRPSEPGDWSTVEFDMPEPQARQFLTLYESLQDFDDRGVLSQLDCPRLCFAGSEDQIVYDERWRGTHVDIAGPLKDNRHELEAAGWSVCLLEGLDHAQAMQPDNVLPVIRPWLAGELAGVSNRSR
ncbi:MAG TPA: alpha/beta hydrolase [Acidimicrobiia bacterium]|nr:alpha/beta hydrolase [Acidimicrobiia bacterium]